MGKVSGSLKKVVIGIIAVVVFVALFRIYFVYKNYVPDEGYYKIADSEEAKIYLHIDGYDIEMLYGDEYNIMFGKATYDTSWRIWQHFAGDLYFKSDNLLSAKLAPKECQPTTVRMKCTDNRYCDTFADSDFTVIRNDSAIGDTQTIDIYFFDESTIIEGEKYEKMESLDDAVLAELIRLFIEPQMNGG